MSRAHALAAFAALSAVSACSPSTPEVEPASASAVASGWPEQSDSGGTHLVVYKKSTCACCNDWVDYMRDNGFRVVAHNVSDRDAVRRRHNIALPLHSCHTTEVGGYYVEGHVPADLVRRLLTERPRIAGLAVPGMPVGSPGMEVGPPEPYDILAVDSAGRTTVFAKR